jgi:cation:H+ antiporter
MTGSQPGRAHKRVAHETAPKPFAGSKTLMIGLLFLAAAGVTLAAGVLLETSGNVLADRAGLNGVVFGATFLAIPAALPEISSGIAAVRLGDNQLAMADIFGGNSFQVCLFLVADLVAGQPVLPEIGTPNAWLAALGILITVVYATSVILRPEKRYLRLGPDSLLAIGIYAVGIAGLLEVTG